MKHIAYVDEVGRGCLAGPVVACAIILPETHENPLFQEIKDSKKVSEKKRTVINDYLKEVAVGYGIGEASPSEIDSVNILQATFLAMHRALDNLSKSPYEISEIHVDGPLFKPWRDMPYKCIVNGDATVRGIGAASIVAKVHRDSLMTTLSYEYPHYEWHKNKGYGTKTHIEGVKKYGVTEHHRKTFSPISSIWNK
jgi:ribonuclease HII